MQQKNYVLLTESVTTITFKYQFDFQQTFTRAFTRRFGIALLHTENSLRKK